MRTYLIWDDADDAANRAEAWIAIEHPKAQTDDDLIEIVVKALIEADEEWPDEEGEYLWVAEDAPGSVARRVVIESYKGLRGRLA